MDFDNIFNATVLVFWSLLLVPYALEENKKWLIGSTGAVILAAEILLAINFAHHDFYKNFLVGIANFLLALIIGYGVHHFQSKQKKKDSQ